MLLFFSGLALGLVLWALSISRQRRRLDRAEEARQKMQLEREQVVDFMHYMVEAVGEGLNRRDLLQRIVHASILSSGALSACIFEKTSRQTMRAVAVEGLFPPHRPLSDEVKAKLATRAKFIEQVLTTEEFPVGEGIVGRVAQSGQGELLEDAERDPAIVKHDDAALTVRSVIAVPLQFRGRFFGVLAVTNPVDEKSFSTADFTLVGSLAEQAALALHNVDLLHLQLEKKQLDLDLSVASSIQQMLLPRAAPHMPGLDLDARYSAAQKIGGDLYDLIPLSATRLGVAVADVSGKGISGALLMAICRTDLRQIAARYASPAKVLTELNRILAADMGQGLFITMLYAVLDLAANTVTFARAGHELPLLGRRDPLSSNYLTEFIGSEGMSLGMVPDEMFAATISDQTESFQPGDVFVLYTDGITEAPNADQKEFSGARLADAVRAFHYQPAKAMNDGILESLSRFTGETEQRDDFTLVTVKRV